MSVFLVMVWKDSQRIACYTSCVGSPSGTTMTGTLRYVLVERGKGGGGGFLAL